MITVDLRVPRTGEEGYDVAATITVMDGVVDIAGDRSVLATDDVRVHTPNGLVSFAEDPETWCRYLHTAYRTPYLVPVVILDTGLQQPDAGASA